VTDLPDEDLTFHEAQLLIAGLDDDISFDWALIRLDLRENPPTVNEPPTAGIIESAFGHFERLAAKGLIAVGRTEYVDPSTAPGTVAPVRHVAEPLGLVRARVQEACAGASDWSGWAFSCWLVNTDAGDRVARRLLAD
jgi:hypothetical protein